MDSFHKPSALSFDGNTSENWRRFKQQFDIYITASGSEKEGDEVKIAIWLNFAGDRGTQRLFSVNICSKKQILPRNFDSSRKAKRSR